MRVSLSRGSGAIARSSVLGYMGYSAAILLPLFVVLTFLLF